MFVIQNGVHAYGRKIIEEYKPKKKSNTHSGSF